MPSIHVCPLSQIPATVRATGARSMVTLISRGTEVIRPHEIDEARHLYVAMSDIVLAMDGEILPDDGHVADVVDFLRRWDRAAPLIIHCYAGVSRSTAAAFIAACLLDETRSEMAIALDIRERSPTATPNALMVKIADRLLGREGRMVEAVRSIGRGAECFEGIPFSIELARQTA